MMMLRDATRFVAAIALITGFVAGIAALPDRNNPPDVGNAIVAAVALSVAGLAAIGIRTMTNRKRDALPVPDATRLRNVLSAIGMSDTAEPNRFLPALFRMTGFPELVASLPPDAYADPAGTIRVIRTWHERITEQRKSRPLRERITERIAHSMRRFRNGIRYSIRRFRNGTITNRVAETLFVPRPVREHADDIIETIRKQPDGNIPNIRLLADIVSDMTMLSDPDPEPDYAERYGLIAERVAAGMTNERLRAGWLRIASRLRNRPSRLMMFGTAAGFRRIAERVAELPDEPVRYPGSSRMRRPGYIYEYRFPDGCFYVGMTNNPQTRDYTHRRAAIHGGHNNIRLGEHIVRYPNIVPDIVAEHPDYWDAVAAERVRIRSADDRILNLRERGKTSATAGSRPGCSVPSGTDDDGQGSGR